LLFSIIKWNTCVAYKWSQICLNTSAY